MNAIVLSALVVIAAPVPPYRPHHKFKCVVRAIWVVTGDNRGVHHRVWFASARFNGEYILDKKTEVYVKNKRVDAMHVYMAHLNSKEGTKVEARVESYNNVITKITFEEGFP